jgi:hypothetical protein
MSLVVIGNRQAPWKGISALIRLFYEIPSCLSLVISVHTTKLNQLLAMVRWPYSHKRPPVGAQLGDTTMPCSVGC